LSNCILLLLTLLVFWQDLFLASPALVGLSVYLWLEIMSLSTRKKRLVQQLRTALSLTERPCIELLQETDWNVEEAADLYYSGEWTGSAESDRDAIAKATMPPLDEGKVGQWFEKYEDAEVKDTMQATGILKFCEDLEVSPMDPVLIVISAYFGAENMLVYTRQEFYTGIQKMGTQDLESLKSKLPGLRTELENEDAFKNIYAFTFGWACPPGQKSMQPETAVELWKLLLVKRFDLLDEWCEYVKKFRTHAISKDEWMLLLEFARVTDKDLNGYDETEAWPVLIDEFVENIKKSRKK